MRKMEITLVGNQSVMYKSLVNFFGAKYRIECVYAVFTHVMMTY